MGNDQPISVRCRDFDGSLTRGGALSPPAIGEFRNARREFYDHQALNGRTIWSDLLSRTSHRIRVALNKPFQTMVAGAGR
jgi:hypothetical protein